MDTKTTVPDTALECHLFTQRLLGDHDILAREKLHGEILDWVSKMESWSGGNHDFVSDFDPPVAAHFKLLLSMLNQKEMMDLNLTARRDEGTIAINSFEKCFNDMLAKQEALYGNNPGDDGIKKLAEKRALLQTWKDDKIASIQKKITGLETELRKVSVSVRETMDVIIDELQPGNGMEEPNPMEISDGEDPIMNELVELMSGRKLAKSPEDSILTKRTLELGECGTPPECILNDAQSQQWTQVDNGVPPAQASPPSASLPTPPEEEKVTQESTIITKNIDEIVQKAVQDALAAKADP